MDLISNWTEINNKNWWQFEHYHIDQVMIYSSQFTHKACVENDILKKKKTTRIEKNSQEQDSPWIINWLW